MDIRENLVVCFGSPLIDLTVHIDNTFLQKYHLSSNGVQSSENPSLFQEVILKNPNYDVGGSITNTCLLLQSLLEFSKSVCYVGAIGNDHHGALIKDLLLRKEVNFLYEIIPNVSTGRCAVLLNNSDRSLVTDLGASRHMSHEYVDSILDVLKVGKFFYVSGYFFGVSTKICETICDFVHNQKKVFIFNIGSASLCQKYPEIYKRIVPFVNILIGNEQEIRSLVQELQCASYNGPSDLRRNIHSLNSYRNASIKGDVITIATRSSERVLVAYKSSILELDVPSLENIGRLNTNGAGDAFLAGFLAGYIKGESLDQCVKTGIKISRDYIISKSF